MDTIIEIQNKFNRELIGGVAYHFLNNPIISWESGFIKGLTAICALFAIVDLALKIKDQKQFAVGFANFAFYLTIILACYGQLNPRRFIDFNLSPKYDYAQRDMSNQASSREMDLTRTKTDITLDRDVYNAVAQFFDDLASTIKGRRTVKNQTTGSETDLQTIAFDSTMFFLKQVRIAKQQCVNQEGKPDYQKCLAAYIPRDVPVDSSGRITEKNCTHPETGQKIICRNGQEDADREGRTESEKKSGGIISMFGGDSITQILGYISAFYTWVYLIQADFLYSIFFPILLYILEFTRSVISLILLIGYGFGAAGMMFFVKLLTPLLLLNKYRSQVFSGYKLLLAMALFGFVSEIFLFFATVLTLGLREAAYNVAIPFMLESNVSGPAGVLQFTTTFGLVLVMVYIAIVSVLLIQIYALTKIPKACKMLTDLSVGGFVAMGGELAGMGAKLGMALGGAALAAPLLATGGAALAVGAKGAALAGKGVASAGAGKGIVGSMMAKGGGTGAIGNMLQRGSQGLVNTANKVAKSGVEGASKGADFFKGKSSGDRIRGIFGGSSGGGSEGGSPKVGISKQIKDTSMIKDGKKSVNKNLNDKIGSKANVNEDGARKGLDPFASGSDGGGNKKGKKSSSKNNKSSNNLEDSRSGLKKLIDKGRQKSKAFDLLASTASGGLAGVQASRKVFNMTKDRFGGIVESGVSTASGGGITSREISNFTKAPIKDIKNISKYSTNKVSEALNNEDNKEKLKNWGESVGLESEDRLISGNSELLNSFSKTGEQELNISEAAQYDELAEKIKNNNFKKEEIAKFAALSRTRSLDEIQSKKFEEVSKTNEYQNYIQKKNQEYLIEKSKYLSTGSSSSARNIASLMNEGFGSGDSSVIKKATSFNNKTYDNKMSSLNEDLSMLNKHNNGDINLKLSERRALANQISEIGNSISSNNKMRSMIAGDSKGASLLSEAGFLTKEEADLISNVQVESKLKEMVKDIDSNILKDNNINIGNEFRVEYLDNGEDFLVRDMNGKVISDSSESFKLSNISDTETRDKLKQYKTNIRYILENSNLMKDPKGNSFFTDSDIKKMISLNDLIEDDI